jgi:hypothetical protein
MTDQGWHVPNKSGIMIFMIGAVIGFLFFLGVFLQDTESIIFSASVSGDDTLRTLNCPELLVGDQTGVVTARVVNNTEKTLFRRVRTYISEGFLLYSQEYNEALYLEPGQSKTFSWSVSPKNAAWGYVILVKVYVFPQDIYPSYVGTCGITTVDLPYVSGWQVIALFWVVSLSLMVIGYIKYLRANQPLVRARRKLAVNMRVIAITIVLAMGTMFLELWYLELIFFIFTIILLAESAFSFSQN